MKLFMLLISITTAIAAAGPLSVSEPAATMAVVNASTVVNASAPVNEPGTADLCSDCKGWMYDCVQYRNCRWDPIPCYLACEKDICRDHPQCYHQCGFDEC